MFTATFVLLLLQFSALPADETADGEAMLRAPDGDWAVRLAPAGFEFGEPVATDDGERSRIAGDGPRGMVATLTLRPAGAAGNAEACRSEADERAGRGAKRTYRLERERRGPLALTAYVVPRYRGVAINQRHVHAFLYRDGYCVELELSMPRYKSRRRHLFDEALDTLEIVDAP